MQTLINGSKQSHAPRSAMASLAKGRAARGASDQPHFRDQTTTPAAARLRRPKGLPAFDHDGPAQPYATWRDGKLKRPVGWGRDVVVQEAARIMVCTQPIMIVFMAMLATTRAGVPKRGGA